MTGSIRFGHLSAAVAICVPFLLCAAAPTARAQVFVVQPQHIEQHYSNFDPTKVKLPSEPLTTVARGAGAALAELDTLRRSDGRGRSRRRRR